MGVMIQRINSVFKLPTGSLHPTNFGFTMTVVIKYHRMDSRFRGNGKTMITYQEIDPSFGMNDRKEVNVIPLKKGTHL